MKTIVGDLRGRKVYLQTIVEVGKHSLRAFWAETRDNAKPLDDEQVSVLLPVLRQYTPDVLQLTAEELPPEHVQGDYFLTRMPTPKVLQ